jgi:hypothetical protein
MIHLSFYVPQENAPAVKATMFAAGGGKIGNYDCCSFDIEGIGQFRPLAGSQPYLGSQDQIEKVREVKVEMLCEEHLINDVIAAMKLAHPYETPAYYVIKTLNL